MQLRGALNVYGFCPCGVTLGRQYNDRWGAAEICRGKGNGQDLFKLGTL